MEGAWTELPMGKARLLEYKEIGIEYQIKYEARDVLIFCLFGCMKI